MTELTLRNTQTLAYHLYVASGSPKGQAAAHWQSAEKQLEQNLFDETGPLPWITPEEIKNRKPVVRAA